jgi:hypothetical protein
VSKNWRLSAKTPSFFPYLRFFLRGRSATARHRIPR